MKNSIIIISLLCLLATSGCKDTTQSFTLNGKIGELNSPATIYFSYFWGGIEYTDSTVLENGKFSFSGDLDCPAPSRLILDYTGNGIARAARAGHLIYLFIEPGTVNLKSADSLQNIVFIKSPINDEHKYYL